jgi:hypothetical protein
MLLFSLFFVSCAFASFYTYSMMIEDYQAGSFRSFTKISEVEDYLTSHLSVSESTSSEVLEFMKLSLPEFNKDCRWVSNDVFSCLILASDIKPERDNFVNYLLEDLFIAYHFAVEFSFSAETLSAIQVKLYDLSL